MVYLHSFLLSNRVAITFPRHEKGDCVRLSASTGCRVYLISMNGCHLLKHLTEPLTCSNYSVITLSACTGVLGPHLHNPPPPFPKSYLQCKVLTFHPWSGSGNYWDCLFKIWPCQFRNEWTPLKKKKWITVCTQLQSGYQTSLIWLKDWRESISACLYVFECLVYIAVYDLHSVSLTLPHNTNLHRMSQLGSCTDTSHNKKNSNKTRRVHLPHIKLACLNKCQRLCSVCVLTAGVVFGSFQKTKLPLVFWWVGAVVVVVESQWKL